MGSHVRNPVLNGLYQGYLVSHDAAAFSKKVAQRYAIGTLERLCAHDQRMTRRAAVLAIGMVGKFESNDVMGRALIDEDRGVRTLADNGIRSLWCRAGSERQQRHLAYVIRMNAARRYEEAIRRATRLIEQAPDLAEGWNQRAIAFFSSGRFVESIRDCEQTLELNPYHFGAATGMAQCHLHLNDRAAALEVFRRALQLNPGLEGVRAHILYLQRALKNQE